ncbi:hypothetical protein D3C81_1808810 [compost metagenome]
MGNLRQRRFNRRQLAGLQQFVRHSGVLQHGDVLGRAVKLLLGAEQLQRAALTAFVLDAGFLTQSFNAVAAVFRQTHHTAFIGHIVGGIAVFQHLPHPSQLETAAV